MKRNISIISNLGFSLLEITVVLIIISVLLSAVIPVFSRSYLEKAANKTALDITAIQEASRKYYIDNNKWPDASVYATPIAALQAGGYLPAGWNATNPFVNYEPDLLDFSYHISANPSLLTVYTNVPADAQPIIENLLSSPTVDPAGTGHNIYSSVAPPGSINSLPVGSVISWSSPLLPSTGGFAWCNGQAVSRSTYSGLFAVIGTVYGIGDGNTTFNLPDMMGRTIVGQDAMGGAVAMNRITQWGTFPSTMGGTFGEDAHRQTLLELAPHTHNFRAYINGVKGFSGNSTFAPRDSTSIGTTDVPNGGTNDGTGKGAAANVVQPSIAMGYIIKL